MPAKWNKSDRIQSIGDGYLKREIYSRESPKRSQSQPIFTSILKQNSTPHQVLKQIGQDHDGKTASQVALNWVLCKGALPIPGAKNAKQAGENSGATGWRLTSNGSTTSWMK